MRLVVCKLMCKNDEFTETFLASKSYDLNVNKYIRLNIRNLLPINIFFLLIFCDAENKPQK